MDADPVNRDVIREVFRMVRRKMKVCLQCRAFVCGFAIVLSTSLHAAAVEQINPVLSLQNGYVRLELGADGRCRQFTDCDSGANHSAQPATNSFASVEKAGRVFPASSVSFTDGKLTVDFGEADVTAMLEVTPKKNCFIFEVVEVRGDGIEELVFADFPLTPKAKSDESFAVCALALNLQTNVRDIPGATEHLWAACYPRFGLVGAKVALIGCPQKELRRILQEVVKASPDLPHSPIGGPWALDAESNRGSYLFNFGDMSEEKVDEWIAFAHSIGVTEIDFHGGSSFRFGDCAPNPKTYPNGWVSFKAVIDRLHAAGLKAGLHTYAQFIDKRTPWVTPVPDPRLGKDATFTLAKPLTPKSTNVFVAESTTNMSVITGAIVRNSVTLQIDDELITYTGVIKTPPFAFTGCQRGANGTRAGAHAPGAKVHHLKECFGLFVPDGDSTLYTEVAAKIAEAFNAGGFDMIYLDALDGSDIFAGPENAWYYQSKFAFEIWTRLKKPALMEMSVFSHHLWFVRSRIGAWDHPNRAYKKFVDIHVAANESNRHMFLPGQLGWWSVQTWMGAQETMFADDMEYLMGKCIGTDTGFALQGMNPVNTATNFAFPRLAKIMREYEALRHANYLTEDVKAKLRVPGDEFTLLQSPNGEWQFRRVQYVRHKVEGLDSWSNLWTVTNRFARQPLQLRIEALMSAGPYESSNNITVLDFGDTRDFSDASNRTGIASKFDSVAEPVRIGVASGRFFATNSVANRRGAWAKAGKSFEPPLNLTGHDALGVWVHGDNKGETLNIQLNSPEHLFSGIAEHYISVNFTGWRYFELIEPDAHLFSDYEWPYSAATYHLIYRETIYPAHISRVNFYYNNLPPNDAVTCHLSPLRALPLIKAKWRNPSLRIGGRTVGFPVEMESGNYLEFRSPTECKLYGQNGALLAEVKPQGDVPILDAGANQLEFSCDAPAGINPRAYVTAIADGEVVRGVNPANKFNGMPNLGEVGNPKKQQQITCVDVFPGGKPQPAIEDKHFPTRLHAFVWRNWESVSLERMAKTVETTPRNIREIGLSMGLPDKVGPIEEFKTRGYVSIIRHNWHLLPYEQLLTLLDWDFKTLDFHLNEDDFLFIKLGNFKPVCEPIKYVRPDEATKKRCAEIKAVAAANFGSQLNKPGQPRFDFVRTLSRPDKSKPQSVSGGTDEQLRFLYSYFALYGDPLSNPDLDPFPDGLLQKLSASGVNGIWMQALLRQLSPPTKDFPEFGEGYETRLKNLRNMVERTNRYGIKIYLYVSEPRAMPPEFFKQREHIKGVSLRGFNTMCTSVPEVRQWVTDSLAYVFKEVPGLGGVFTISKCENPTSCYSDCLALEANGCPRCSKRTGPEVIAEINNAIAAGVWKGNPNAKVLIWDWLWPDEWIEPIISRLPRNAYLMTVSEWDKPIVRGGVESKVDEYSISGVGPSERARFRWSLARKYGLKTSAKIQVNTTWELSTLPYLPAMNLVAQHCENLSHEDVNSLMLSWSLGGCPSPNLKLVKLFSQKPAPTVNEALTEIATEYYGADAALDVLDAWSKFSDAFAEYPFSRSMLYLCPVQLGPANLLYPTPTGYGATMVGFAYDDLASWVANYPVDVFASQFEKVAAGWQFGLAAFERAVRKTKTTAQTANARADLRIAEAARLHFKSVANQVRFTKARNALLNEKLPLAQRQNQINIIKSVVADEIDLAMRLYALAKEDSRIGFEATNQYHYLPLDLVEKVVNCEYVLKKWLPTAITAQTDKSK